jgi:predicted CopG family antitoxin
VQITTGIAEPVATADSSPLGCSGSAFRWQHRNYYLTYRPDIRTMHVYWRCFMQKKLTITVDEEVYAGLHKVIGPRKISRFIQEIVRPHVVRPNYEAAYAEMAKDKKRENEALEWAENTFKDIDHETR